MPPDTLMSEQDQNAAASLKRKDAPEDAAPEEGFGALSSPEGKKEAVASAAKKPKVSTLSKTPVIELKGTKITCKQKPVALDKLMSTMSELLAFHTHTNSLSAPLASFPDAHLPLLSKLAHENDKDKGFADLARGVKAALVPVQVGLGDSQEEEEKQDVIPNNVVSAALKKVVKRVDYGLTSDALPSSLSSSAIPAALTVYRWEALDAAHLPPEARDGLLKRAEERAAAQRDVVEQFKAMGEKEQEELLGAGKRKKAAVAENPKQEPMSLGSDGDVAMVGTSISTPKSNGGAAAKGKTDEDAAAKAKAKAEKQVAQEKKAAEQAAKKAEREAKKAAEEERKRLKEERVKEKEEKERKASEAKQRQRGLMSNFFSKASKPETPSKPSTSATSYFQRAFRDFHVKTGVTLAPINRFRKGLPKPDTDLWDAEPVPDPLPFFLASVPATRRTHRPRRSAEGMAISPPYELREMMRKLGEAEAVGNEAEAKSILEAFKSRGGGKIKYKLLWFHEDTRPGYWGTFTKSSSSVGPRTPFAQDKLVFDYAYDSEEEWEEPEEGEGDDIASVGARSDSDNDDADSDADSWLVSDTEDVGGEDIDLDAVEGGADPNDPFAHAKKGSSSPSKEKERARRNKDKATRKKKAVQAVAPFIAGPQWEAEVGKIEYEPFRAFQVCLLNDTPFPIDPFKFTSTATASLNPTPAAAAAPSARPAIITASTSCGAKAPATITASTPCGARAALASTSSPMPPPSSSTPTNTTRSTKAASSTSSLQAQADKFPSDLLPAFLRAIDGSERTRVLLVEDLRQAFPRASKSSIEAKLRECAKRNGQKQGAKWAVLDEAWRKIGLSGPGTSVSS